MREIKFRAWHKGYDRPLVKTPIRPRMLHEDTSGQVLTWLAQGQPLEVMQFTGLHDKNGREIYEGDILRCSIVFEDVTLPHMGMVVYSEEYATFATENEAGNTSFLHHCVNTREVIGNIYENEDLLNG